MSAAQAIIEKLEALGYSFALQQGRITASLPAGYRAPDQAATLLEELRSHRSEALRILQLRADQQAGFRIVADDKGFSPVILRTFDIAEAVAIKRAMDAGEIALIGQVEYSMPSGRITIHYRPLVPPEWINLQQHREAAEKKVMPLFTHCDEQKNRALRNH